MKCCLTCFNSNSEEHPFVDFLEWSLKGQLAEGTHCKVSIPVEQLYTWEEIG
jgi:hypothetical protein